MYILENSDEQNARLKAYLDEELQKNPSLPIMIGDPQAVIIPPQASMVAWFNQVVQQFKDLTYEDGSPVFAAVQAGLIQQLDQQPLPCVSVVTPTGTDLVALVFVAKLTDHQWKYPTPQRLDASVLQESIQEATSKNWEKQGIPGSIHSQDGITYQLLEYTFVLKGDQSREDREE